MRISATSTTTKKAWPRTAKTATRTRRTSTGTRKIFTRICGTTGSDTNQFRGCEKRAARGTLRPLFIFRRAFASDADGAFENFHGGAAYAPQELLSTPRDFHLALAVRAPFPSLQSP